MPRRKSIAVIASDLRPPPTLLLFLAGLGFAALLGLTYASNADAEYRPTRAQQMRLYHLEPYIRYFSSISYGSGGARVSADFIRALILAESAGDKWAESSKGARGLTQILPSTGRVAVSRLAQLNLDYRYVDERRLYNFDVDSLYDPALNILIACYLNAMYHQQYDGRVDLVAAAWNAGPHSVARYGNEPPPYPETRTFIRRVRGYMDYFDSH